jgi:hypothetical protein
MTAPAGCGEAAQRPPGRAHAALQAEVLIPGGKPDDGFACQVADAAVHNNSNVGRTPGFLQGGGNMRAAPVYLLLLVAFLLPQAGVAQDQQAMGLPVLKTGDRWVYSWKNSRGENGRTAVRVARIADFEGAPAYYTERDAEWTTSRGQRRTSRRTHVRDMQLNRVAILDEQGRVVRRDKVQWLRWPLTVGAQWESEGAYEFLERGSWTRRRATVFVQVREAAQIPGPQGQVLAFRLYWIFRWLSSEGTPLGHEVWEEWISPAVRGYVRGSLKSGTYQEEYELTEFQLTP